MTAATTAPPAGGNAGSWLKGTVFSVESGDTLTLAGPPRPNGPPLKKQITLSSLVAPKLGRRDGSTADEPFAYASREFLRRLAIGKPATFRVDYTLDAAPGRAFGSVFVGPDSTNAAVAVAGAGWARVRRATGPGPASPYVDDLVAASEAAEAAGAGVFGGDGGAADAAGPPPAGASGAAFFAAAGGAGADLTGVVEYVASGSFVRVTFPGARGVPLLVAGVAAPPVRAAAAAAAAPADGAAPAPPPPPTADPFGPVAKHFVEARALGRDVGVTLRGVDKHGNVLASIALPSPAPAAAPSTDLAVALADAGLAKAVEWGLAALPPPAAAAVRDADRRARAARAGVWRGYTPPPGGAAKAAGEVSGVVVEVVSGDCVVVAAGDGGGGPETRLFLASVRAPRPARRDAPGEPWGDDAKEFLRARVVGKKVVAKIEYERKVGGGPTPAPPAAGAAAPAAGAAAAAALKPAATLTFATLAVDRGPGKEPFDPSRAVVAAGLATVARHRADDERAAGYQALADAEAAAKEAKRGLHSAKEPAPRRANDVSAPGSAARARGYLPFMTRGVVTGVVEHVSSGHRVKVYVPSQGVTVAFSPQGVRAPSSKPGAPPPPFAAEATAFVRRHALQRDCELRVAGCDKGGTFLGEMTVPASGFALAPALLKAGLARLAGPADPPDDLVAAQAVAKEAGRGLWSLPQEEEDDAAAAGAPSAAAISPSVLDVVITDVRHAGALSYQRAGDPRVPWLRDALAAAAFDRSPPSTTPPAVGALVAARFAGDGGWYRARVDGKPGAGRLAVTFIDWGNAEVIASDDVRALPPDLADTRAVPPQATAGALALVKPTGDGDARAAAADAVAAALGGGGRLRAAVLGEAPPPPAAGAAWGGGGGRKGRPPPVAALLIADPDAAAPTAADAPPAAEASVQAALLRAGALRLDTSRRALVAAAGGDAVDALTEAEAEARRAHVGVWEYGDPGSDDE